VSLVAGAVCPSRPHPLAPSPIALPPDRERGNDE
jgi:hypothetical protein